MTESNTVSPALREFLEWVALRERTYEQTMDAWRTACPRFSVWEDASMDRLVSLESRPGSNAAVVVLTPRGRSILTNRTDG